MTHWGGIRWDQVIGWNTIPVRAKDGALAAYVSQLANYFTPNPDYNVKYDTWLANGPQPQLADGATAYSRAIEFMNQPNVGEAVGWNKETGFPLFTAPDHADIVASAEKAAEEIEVEAKLVVEATDEASRARNWSKHVLDAKNLMEEAKKTAEAARKARLSTKKIARICDEHVRLPSEPYLKAFYLTEWARAAVAEVTNSAYTKAARMYRMGAQKAAEMADADKAKAEADKIPELKKEASEDLTKKVNAKQRVSDMIEELRSEVEAQVLRKEPLVELVMDPKVVEAADVIWSRTRDFDLLWAASYEQDLLIREIGGLRTTIEEVGQEMDLASKASQEAQKKAEKAAKKEGKERSRNGGKSREGTQTDTTAREAEAAEEKSQSGDKSKEGPQTDTAAREAEAAKEKVIGEVQQLNVEASGEWWAEALMAATAKMVAVGGAVFLTSVAASVSGVGPETVVGIGAGIGGSTGVGISTGKAIGPDRASLSTSLSTMESISVASAEVEAYVNEVIAKEMAKSVARTSLRAERAAVDKKPVRQGLVTAHTWASEAGEAFKRAALKPFAVRAAKVAVQRAIESAGRQMEVWGRGE